jgi:hypothetical protein
VIKYFRYTTPVCDATHKPPFKYPASGLRMRSGTSRIQRKDAIYGRGIQKRKRRMMERKKRKVEGKM